MRNNQRKVEQLDKEKKAKSVKKKCTSHRASDSGKKIPKLKVLLNKKVNPTDPKVQSNSTLVTLRSQPNEIASSQEGNKRGIGLDKS